MNSRMASARWREQAALDRKRPRDEFCGEVPAAVVDKHPGRDDEIWRLHKQGLKCRDIGERISPKLSKQCVAYHIKAMAKEGRV